MDRAKQAFTKPEQDTARKRPYKKPQLLVYGSVLEVILGASPGIQDTGDPFLTKPPGP